MASVRYTFTLDAVRDADIVRWLELQANTSSAVRDALRAYVARPTLFDLDAKLDKILDTMRGVHVVTVGGDGALAEPNGEPAAARRGLDAMKARFRAGDQ